MGPLGGHAAGGTAEGARAQGRPAGTPAETGLQTDASRGGGRGGGSGGGAPPSGEPGAEAHEVAVKLSGAETADSERMKRLLEVYPWLAAFSDAERLALLGRPDREGIWGACWALRLFGRCRIACDASAKPCTPMEGWQACMDARGDELTCIAECRTQIPCSTPEEVFARHCVVRAPAQPPAQCGPRARVETAEPAPARPARACPDGTAWTPLTRQDTTSCPGTTITVTEYYRCCVGCGAYSRGTSCSYDGCKATGVPNEFACQRNTCSPKVPPCP